MNDHPATESPIRWYDVNGFVKTGIFSASGLSVIQLYLDPKGTARPFLGIGMGALKNGFLLEQMLNDPFLNPARQRPEMLRFRDGHTHPSRFGSWYYAPGMGTITILGEKIQKILLNGESLDYAAGIDAQHLEKLSCFLPGYEVSRPRDTLTLFLVPKPRALER